VTIEEAIRNAIETERFSAYYYDQLSLITEDRRARGFLMKIAAQERRHAAKVERLGLMLADRELVRQACVDVSLAETTCSSWDGEETITYHKALEIALETKNNVERFYRTLAGLLRGEVVALFTVLADDEREQIQALERFMRTATPPPQRCLSH